MSETPNSPPVAGVRATVAVGPPGYGAVAAGSRDTAQAAADVLAAGGNAVDAAIAGTLAACVAEVVFTSLGGGGFLLLAEPSRKPRVVDFFVDIPGRGAEPSDSQATFTPITVRYPGTEQVFHAGPGAVAVPGALEGLLHAHNHHGRAPIATVVQPAIDLATEGAVLEPVQAQVLALVREIMSLTPECRDLILTGDRFAVAGDLMRNPDYARFLSHVASGEITSSTSPLNADPLLDLMAHTAGHVTRADLQEYRVAERAPLHVERAGHSIALNAPPAFGGSIVAEALRQLPVLGGSASDWVAAVRALQAATERVRLTDDAAGIPHATQGTTHISAVDADGLVASMTTSNGSGSGVLLPGTGVHLNNMLGEEDLNPDGFHSAAPGTRMGSMMSPCIVTGPDGSVTGLGTGGSERIRSALLTALIRLIDLGCTPEEAIDAPRMHPDAQWVQMEPGWDPDLRASLQHHHPVNTWGAPNLFYGGIHAATRFADGSVKAVGDSRRGGMALVVPMTGEPAPAAG